MRQATVASLVFLALLINTAPAGAHVFLASSTGKITVKLLSALAYNNGSGTVECNGARLVEGEVRTTKSLFLTSTIEFESCKAFGFVTNDVDLVRVRSTAEGSISLLRSVTITPLGAGCSITFPSSKNQNLGTVKYKNTNKKIEKIAQISHLTNESTGGLCGSGTSGGAFTGNALVGLIGGTIDWQ